MVPQFGPTDAAGVAPGGPASRSPIPIFAVLCVGFSALMHAEPLAASAAELHLQPGVVAGVVLSVAALFNLAILSLNSLVARWPAAGGATLLPHADATTGAEQGPTASASRSPLALFMFLCLAMSAGMHAKPLAAAAAEYQIHPAAVVCVVLAGAALFHLAILSIYESLASHQAEVDEPKKLRRFRGLPLLPFVVLALAIPTASSAETVMAAGATDLPQDASVWVLLALAVSFNIAIGSLYCFVIVIVIDGPPPPAAASVQPRSWRSKAAGATISVITAAVVLASSILISCGGASGAVAARS